ncbi:unnamed protein product [Boreogadus saida]
MTPNDRIRTEPPGKASIPPLRASHRLREPPRYEPRTQLTRKSRSASTEQLSNDTPYSHPIRWQKVQFRPTELHRAGHLRARLERDITPRYRGSRARVRPYTAESQRAETLPLKGLRESS